MADAMNGDAQQMLARYRAKWATAGGDVKAFEQALATVNFTAKKSMKKLTSKKRTKRGR